MRRPGPVAEAFRSAVCCVALASVASVHAATVTVVSDRNWLVSIPDPADTTKQIVLGLSELVCLSATQPAGCMTGVSPPPVSYDWSGAAWAATAPGLPANARWMWAPGVTGATTPAAGRTFTFTKDDIYVCNPPQDATISVAVDDSAKVSVNGNAAVAVTGFDRFTTFTVPAASIYGSTVVPPAPRANRIEITATNAAGPSCAADNYGCNPAGVLFWASFKFDDQTCNATRSGGPAGGYGTGQSETLASCPAGQSGSVYHVCVCGTWLPSVNACVAPKQCTGTATNSAGRSFAVDAIESQTCPAGTSAAPASHTCLASGDWDMPLGACVAPPTTCQGSDGTTRFGVGASETRGCAAPGVGTQSRTCQPTGRFGDWSGCPLPVAAIGDACGTTTGPATAQCPQGTACGTRRISSAPGSLVTSTTYCDPVATLPVARDGATCGSRTDGATGQCRAGATCLQGASANAVCVPNTGPPLPLGASCTRSADCGSGRCDAGFNTAGTNICTPRAAQGLTGDPCSNDNQCASGRCANLKSVAGKWIPGQCR